MMDSKNRNPRKSPALRNLAFVLSAFVILAGLIILLGEIFMNSSPVPVKYLRQLNQGMSKDEVIGIIGPPPIENKGDRTWQYHRPLLSKIAG